VRKEKEAEIGRKMQVKERDGHTHIYKQKQIDNLKKA